MANSIGYVGLTIFITVFAGLVSTVTFHTRAQQRAQATLAADVHQLAVQLDRVVDQGMISGALRVLGTLDERIKERLTLGRPVDMASRALVVGSDGLMLIDTYGRVLERWDPDQERYSAPMWADSASSSQKLQAQGPAAVQVVVDTASMDHSLLLLAPVWGGPGTGGINQQLIGSVVARLDPGTVRRYVSMSDARITLVAPNGRLVAASTAQGALRRAPETNEAGATAGLFPMAPGDEGSGASRVIIRHALSWNSPQMVDRNNPVEPVWSIVVTKDLPPIDWINGPQVVPTLVVLVLTPTLLLLLLKLLRVRVDRKMTQRALSEQTRQAAEEARWRADINKVALALQDARSPQAAAHTGLRLMQELLGLARGAVFALRADQSLEPIGQWACQASLLPQAAGQGLIGQVARDFQTIEFDPAATDRPAAVVSALGQSASGHRMVLPLLHLEECLGVVELDWVSAATEERRQRTREVASLLAMNLRFLRAGS